MTKEETFQIEEYKALREEILTKLKDRLEFNRWGLIGLAALYGYIFSNPGKPILFWVPVCLSLAMIAHLNEEHRMVAEAATYIKTQIERWVTVSEAPQGWETYKYLLRTPRWWYFWRRWPGYLWDWSPVPLWLSVLVLTLILAIGVSVGQWPSLIGPISCLPG